MELGALALAMIGPEDSLLPIFFTALLIGGGLVGIFLPFVPGLALIYLGTAFHVFPGWSYSPISVPAFLLLTLIFIVAQGMEMGAGFLGAKSQGMGWPGFIAGIVGLIVGIFLGPLGVIFLPPVLILLAQRFITKQDTKRAFRTTVAFLLGNFVGLVFKLIGAVMLLLVFGFAVAGYL